MNIQQVIYGVVIFLVFWAFQAGYVSGLGNAAWFVGVIIFSVLLMLIGKAVMPKPSAEQKMLWNFATGLAVVLTALMSFAAPFIGVVFPPNFDPSQLTPLVLSSWLIVFGGALFAGSFQGRNLIGLLTSIFWLFSSIHLLSLGPNSYIHFAVVASIPMILNGLLMKK